MGGPVSGSGLVAGSPRAIPRVIHQVWLSGPIPAEPMALVAQLKANNPAWEHRFYDDEHIQDWIAAHYGAAMLATYRRIDARYPAARTDLFRYLVVHAIGGVYLDVKCSVTRPLDEVVQPDDQFLLAQWRNGRGEVHEGSGLHRELAGVSGGEFQQWHVIGARKHPFLAAAIDRVVAAIQGYDPWRAGAGFRGVLRTTGPIPYTLAIAPLLDHHPYRRVVNEAEAGLAFDPAKAAYRGTGAHYSQMRLPLVPQPWPTTQAFAAYQVSRKMAGKLREQVHRR